MYTICASEKSKKRTGIESFEKLPRNSYYDEDEIKPIYERQKLISLEVHSCCACSNLLYTEVEGERKKIAYLS